ncbi:MAG: hypothetical protein ABSA47_07250 [Verrucomicrobiota bacterium]
MAWIADTNVNLRFSLLFVSCCVMALLPTRALAFSLLGPYEAWMQQSNGFRLPYLPNDNPVHYGDIGGPTALTNAYRWNVPVLTYGFDPSFLSFFGSNGVAAVEGAIQIVNDLPAASDLDATNYPDLTQLVNPQAQAQSLHDLRSSTLSLLLEQMGLDAPSAGMYILDDWGFASGEFFFSLIQRNYDPETLAITNDVNTIHYGFLIYMLSADSAYLVIGGTPSGDSTTAVAEKDSEAGGFYTGLTADDVGGLIYLLSTNHIAYELLPPDVSGIGPNAGAFVNGAWRPGVNHITFVPQSVTESGQFVAMTNQFSDVYLTNGSALRQQVQRVTSQPDFLFCAGDTAEDVPVEIAFTRTGTSNWVNNAALNGNPSGSGPGVIQPQSQITFAKAGRRWVGSDFETNLADESWYWGSYDQSTNPPVVYPASQSGTNCLLVHLWINGLFASSLPEPGPPRFDLCGTSEFGATFLLQTSTNLMDWSSVATYQNNGAIGTFLEAPPLNTRRFYRLIPQ